MATDEWVKSAMTDDALVADFLIHIKRQASLMTKIHVFTWGNRKPRSRKLASVSADNKKDAACHSARGSPTTPLSWTGGASGSGSSADGSEESTPCNGSKGTAANDSNANATNSNRSTRKKTFAQLKEQEAILMEESVHLKKEIATMHAKFFEHKAQNENLKRIKLDFGLASSLNGTTAAADKRTQIASTSTSNSTLPGAVHHNSASGSSQPSTSESAQRDRGFLLPDLNMLPSEEDSGSETLLYGTS